MLQIRVHHMFLLWALIFICNIATAVYGQVNAELDKPFITKDGTAYRDKLTIASSKGVAQFAKAYNKRQRARVILICLYFQHSTVYNVLKRNFLFDV